MQKFKTVAKKFGTFVSPTTGSILYVDPGHDNELHHSPLLTQAEAARAFEMGLIKDPDNAKAADETDAESDPNALSAIATERTAEFAKVDAAAGSAPSALDSRNSTAWSDPDRVLGGAEGRASGHVFHGDDLDADAAPAPARKPTQAARKPASAKASTKTPAAKAAPKPAKTPAVATGAVATPRQAVPRLGQPGSGSVSTSPPAPVTSESGDNGGD